MWKRWHGHIGFKVHALMRISKYIDLYTSLNYLSVICLFLFLNSFSSSRSPIFLIIYDLCIFLNCIFLLGHPLLSFDHCFASTVFKKYHFVMVLLNFFLFYIAIDGNRSGLEYIKYGYSLTKNVLHKYEYFSFSRKLTLYW